MSYNNIFPTSCCVFKTSIQDIVPARGTMIILKEVNYPQNIFRTLLKLPTFVANVLPTTLDTISAQLKLIKV